MSESDSFRESVASTPVSARLSVYILRMLQHWLVLLNNGKLHVYILLYIDSFRVNSFSSASEHQQERLPTKSIAACLPLYHAITLIFFITKRTKKSCKNRLFFIFLRFLYCVLFFTPLHRRLIWFWILPRTTANCLPPFSSSSSNASPQK